MSNKQKAILVMLTSTFCFSVMQLIVKLSAGAIPTMEQVFVRNFVTLFYGFFMVRRTGGRLLGKRENWSRLLIRAVGGYVGIVGYFYATTHMNTADASLLNRSSPFFVMLISAIFLKSRITRHQILALALAFAGAVLAIDPRFNSDLLPAAAGVLSAAGAAVGYVMISTLRGKESNATIIFTFSLVSCLLSVIQGGSEFVLPQGSQWLLLAGLGASAAVGQILLTQAYKMADTGEMSIINYTGILFSALLGTLFLDQPIELRTACGIVLIFAAALVLYFTKERPAKAA